jgi:hypothetical protein
MRVGEFLAVVHLFGVEKPAFLVERKPQRLMGLTAELVFEMIHVVHPGQAITPVFS